MANMAPLEIGTEIGKSEQSCMDCAVEFFVERFLDAPSNPKPKAIMDGHSEAEWADSLLTYLYRYFMEYAQHGLSIEQHNNKALKAFSSVFLAPEYAGILLRYYRCANECDSHLTYV